MEIEVAVQPQLVGTLPNGLELVSVRLQPKQVKIMAPAGETQQKINLLTEPIYLESIKKDTKFSTKIVAPPNIQPAGKKWLDVEVRIKVKVRN